LPKAAWVEISSSCGAAREGTAMRSARCRRDAFVRKGTRSQHGSRVPPPRSQPFGPVPFVLRGARPFACGAPPSARASSARVIILVPSKRRPPALHRVRRGRPWGVMRCGLGKDGSYGFHAVPAQVLHEPSELLVRPRREQAETSPWSPTSLRSRFRQAAPPWKVIAEPELVGQWSIQSAGAPRPALRRPHAERAMLHHDYFPAEGLEDAADATRQPLSHHAV
jgi:hypothetical protein